MRKLCGRAAQFKVAYQFPQAHRTSNMVDRLMNHQDRLLYTMQYFHGACEIGKTLSAFYGTALEFPSLRC